MDLYPQGASPVGALDMSGNVDEWCLNEFKTPRRADLSGTARRVVRGGSWVGFQARARDFPRRRRSWHPLRLPGPASGAVVPRSVLSAVHWGGRVSGQTARSARDF
jgi:sulfatase-modifying factor enzyme 1